MPVGRGGGVAGADRFARYPPLTYATLQEGLVGELVARRVGRNGWAVMVALCRRVYADGRLGRASAEEVAGCTGLSAYQVARGMAELRDKGVIAPVIRRTAEGRRVPDRSNFGHVAQYCITREVWAKVSTETAGSG